MKNIDLCLRLIVVAVLGSEALMLSLVPSQVGSRHRHGASANDEEQTDSDRVDAAALRNTNDFDSREDSQLGHGTRRKSGTRSKHVLRQASKNKQQFSRSGDLPDVHWRSVPLEHLRQHPLFEPLPHESEISQLRCLEDARYFRQGSWQWDALHEGRCTTSQAVAALGMLEPQAGKELGIPAVWLRGAQGAFHRLRKPAIRTLEDMNEKLCGGLSGGFSFIEKPFREETSGRNPWFTPSSQLGRPPFPFAAKYMHKTTDRERKERKRLAVRLSHDGSLMSVRTQWGNAQEPTAILTALNYFWKKEPGITLKEVGMCGAGLSCNSTDSSSPLLVGATPDAVICYPDGSVEVLEVKNHCPFVPTRWKRTKAYSIREMAFSRPYLPSHYVPQLMMEMMCVGPSCRSAIMVRQTASSGAVLVRLQRNDAWINEMMYWLSEFQTEFVEKGTEPPKDFFFNNDKYSSRYKNFLQFTKHICEKGELLDEVKHKDIQRVQSAGQHANLFLD